MSSDAYRVKVLSVNGREVSFEIKPTTAGGLADMATTRSFVAMLLYDVGGPSLFTELNDEAWAAANLDKYVVSVRVVSIIGRRTEDSIRWAAEHYCVPIRHLQPRITLIAEMATEELASHFEGAGSFGTTAFDIWWNDPKRPSVQSDWVEPQKFDPDPGLAQRLVPLVRARLTGWVPEGEQSLALVGEGGGRLVVTLAMPFGQGFLREAFSVSTQVFLEGLERFYDRARGIPGPALLEGGIAPDSYDVWCRTCDIYTEDPESAPRESDESVADRIAAQLSGDHLRALVTGDGVAQLVESVCGGLVKRFGVRTFSPLRPQNEVSKLERWSFHSRDSDIFWKRIALYSALGDDICARSAAEQACAKWKKRPKWILGQLSRLGINP